MKKIIIYLGIIIILVPFLIPQNLEMPVYGANNNDYNHKSFWYYPWGKSVVHKGVDIFGKKGTPIKSSTVGLVLATGEFGKGGKIALILGPKWRLHYYAHLNEIRTSAFSIVTRNSIIGTVGNTGNAATTPSHLHYGIATVIPYPWRIDKSRLGWQKMFYLNPIDFLNEESSTTVSSEDNKIKGTSNSSINKKIPSVKEGDIIFQTSRSNQSKLIQYATQSKLTHCGIVVKVGEEYKVLEASNVVKLTSVSDFIAKGQGHKYWIKESSLKGKSIQYEQYLGKKYDIAFKLDNDKYYCSELVYQIYKEQFNIILCELRPVSSYKIEGIESIIKHRGININQQVVSPSDLY